jgi:transposase-like protein
VTRTVEQDHCGVKARTGPMLGFKRIKTAAITITEIELLRRIYKCQYLGPDGFRLLRGMEAKYPAAMAA